MNTLSQHAEHFFRQELSLLLAMPQSRLHKSAPLDEVVPRSDRRRIWREAEARLGLKFPPLYLSSKASWFGLSAVIGNAVRVAAVCLLLGAPWAIMPLALVTAVLTGWVFLEISRPWAVWNSDLPTYGELVHWLVRHNAGKLRRRFGIKLTREEIFEIVREILVDQLGVQPHEVQWETRLADLGGM